MNSFNKTVTMLTLTALLSGTSMFGMQEAPQSPDSMIKESHGLVADLKAYKKCRGTEQGCPQELVERMQARGKTLAKGAAVLGAVVAVAGGAKYGHGKYLQRKWKGDLTEEGYMALVNKYKFTADSTDNTTIVKYAAENNGQALNYVGQSEPGAVKAAIFIAKQHGYNDLAKAIEAKKKVRSK